MKNLKEFAHYLRKNYLRAYVVESLRMINTMHIPMMKLFAHLSEEELISISLLSSEKFLVSLEDGTALEKAKESLQKWEADSLPGISKYDIQSADLLLVYAAQKKSLYHFLHFFTTDSAEQISIVYELEDYFTRVQEVAISLLLKIQKEKEEQIQTLNTHLGLRNLNSRTQRNKSKNHRFVKCHKKSMKD